MLHRIGEVLCGSDRECLPFWNYFWRGKELFDFVGGNEELVRSS